MAGGNWLHYFGSREHDRRILRFGRVQASRWLAPLTNWSVPSSGTGMETQNPVKSQNNFKPRSELNKGKACPFCPWGWLWVLTAFPDPHPGAGIAKRLSPAFSRFLPDWDERFHGNSPGTLLFSGFGGCGVAGQPRSPRRNIFSPLDGAFANRVGERQPGWRSRRKGPGGLFQPAPGLFASFAKSPVKGSTRNCHRKLSEL